MSTAGVVIAALAAADAGLAVVAVVQHCHRLRALRAEQSRATRREWHPEGDGPFRKPTLTMIRGEDAR